MKAVVWSYKNTSYSFDAAAGTVTLHWVNSFSITNLLAIINLTHNTVIYKPNNAAFGGTATDNVVTLTYDTSSMADTNELMIFLDVDETAYSSQNDAKKTFPQSFASVYSWDYLSLTDGTSTVATATSTREDIGDAFYVRDVELVSLFVSHTNNASTNVKLRLQFSDSNGGVYYTPLDGEYVLWDTTGTKTFAVNTKAYVYAKVQWYVETATDDTVDISVSKTLSS